MHEKYKSATNISVSSYNNDFVLVIIVVMSKLRKIWAVNIMYGT